MKTFVRFVDTVNKYVKVFVIACLMAAFGATFLQVVVRNLTTLSLPWTDELSRYLTIWIVYFASGLAARDGRMIRMEVLPMLAKMSDKNLRVLYWVAAFITIAFSALVAYSSIFIIKLNMNKMSASLGINMWIPYLAIPIGSLWFLCCTFANIMDLHLKAKEEEAAIQA